VADRDACDRPMTPAGAEAPMVKVLARLCLDTLRRSWELATELQALWLALAERGVVISAEELARAKAALGQVLQLERAMTPDWAVKVATLAERLRRGLEELEKS